MFHSRPVGDMRNFRLMRLVGLGAVIALITLVTAFDYAPSDLPFVDAAEQPADVFEGELSPGESAPASESATPNPLTLSPIGEFDAPVELVARAGDERSFIVQQGGQIIASDNSLILDLSELALADGERGLLGAAFHPTLPVLYVHYSDLRGDSVVAEYQIDRASGVADATTARVVMTVAQPYENHNGGELVFGPDDLLYVGLGDGGLADDPVRSALDLSSPLGKILRFDPIGSTAEAFTVPADNPFVGQDNAEPTVWSYGLRNPWKFSFDSATGDLWIADVGQNQWEEINHAGATNGVGAGRGVSFGWSAFEGDVRFNDDQPESGHAAPVHTYARADGQCSISGGAVYRGAALPQLDGWFVYGDYCTGTIWGFDTALAPEDRTVAQLAQTEALAAIATGGDGELYAVSITGAVAKLT